MCVNAEISPGVKRGGTVNLVDPLHRRAWSGRSTFPAFIEVDISDLEISYSKHLDDIKLPEGVRRCAPTSRS